MTTKRRRSLLSIRQPWAWAVVSGYKPIENRRWIPNYRGPLYIHAGRQEDVEDLDHVVDGVRMQTGETVAEVVARYERERALGAVVGLVDLKAVVQSTAEVARWFGARWPRAQVEHWFQGPFGLVFTDAERFAEPVPLRGRLGIWQADFMTSDEVDMMRGTR